MPRQDHFRACCWPALHWSCGYRPPAKPLAKMPMAAKLTAQNTVKANTKAAPCLCIRHKDETNGAKSSDPNITSSRKKA
ncbi:MAG: hypothetical protein K0R61_4225 [Microvirga sp.]|nr:hypothetical protein [Microvirga sp.]